MDMEHTMSLSHGMLCHRSQACHLTPCSVYACDINQELGLPKCHTHVCTYILIEANRHVPRVMLMANFDVHNVAERP